MSDHLSFLHDLRIKSDQTETMKSYLSKHPHLILLGIYFNYNSEPLWIFFLDPKMNAYAQFWRIDDKAHLYDFRLLSEKKFWVLIDRVEDDKELFTIYV